MIVTDLDFAEKTFGDFVDEEILFLCVNDTSAYNSNSEEHKGKFHWVAKIEDCESILNCTLVGDMYQNGTTSHAYIPLSCIDQEAVFEATLTNDWFNLSKNVNEFLTSVGYWRRWA